MIKNILIAVLFVALSAFAISATLKSSPEPAAPAEEEYAKTYSFVSYFKDVVEAKLKSEAGIDVKLPDTFEIGSREYAKNHQYVIAIPEGTIKFWFEEGFRSGYNGYNVVFYSRR